MISNLTHPARNHEKVMLGAGVHGLGECGCPLCGGCGWNSPWLPYIYYTPASTGETTAYTSGTGKQWLGGTADGACSCVHEEGALT